MDLDYFTFGEEEIPIGQDIFTETPFFKPPHSIKIITEEGPKYITDCASMAYVSLTGQ